MATSSDRVVVSAADGRERDRRNRVHVRGSSAESDPQLQRRRGRLAHPQIRGRAAAQVHVASGGRDGWTDGPDFEQWLRSYRPRVVRPEQWDGPVQSFVVDSLRRLAPHGRGTASRFAAVLVQHAVWCVEQGLELNPEVALDPQTVERFIGSLVANPRSRATYRADLRRIGPSLTRLAPWEPPAPRLTGRVVSPPYSTAELASLRRDLEAQPSETICRAALAVYIVGLAVGLDGRWTPHLRGTDVTQNAAGVSLAVLGPCPRVVPARAELEDELMTIVGDPWSGGV